MSGPLPFTPLPFTPVPVRARRDGWTPERQTAFVAALARTCCVTAAARAVGMSWQGAYRLRDRPDATGFAAAWDAALASPWDALASALAEDNGGRAIDGIVEPITWRGRPVGERRRHDDRLAMFLLRTHAPNRFGVAAHDRSGADLWEALAELEADLATGVASRDGRDLSRDVDSTSSPSAPRARPQRRCDRGAPARPAGGASRPVRRHAINSHDALAVCPDQ